VYAYFSYLVASWQAKTYKSWGALRLLFKHCGCTGETVDFLDESNEKIHRICSRSTILDFILVAVVLDHISYLQSWLEDLLRCREFTTDTMQKLTVFKTSLIIDDFRWERRMCGLLVLVLKIKSRFLVSDCINWRLTNWKISRRISFRYHRQFERPRPISMVCKCKVFDWFAVQWNSLHNAALHRGNGWIKIHTDFWSLWSYFW